MASGDEPPRRSISAVYSGGRKKKLVTRQGPAQPTVPETTPQPPPPHPPATSPHYSSPDATQSFYPSQSPPSPIQERRAEQVEHSEGGRQYIEPVGDNFQPPSEPVHMIRDIIRGRYDQPYISWKKVSQPTRDMWFREFEKAFWWLPQNNSTIRLNFEKKRSARMRDMLNDVRKDGVRPSWVSEAIYDALQQHWSTPEFIKKREQNRQNRASDIGGLGPAINTGGSVPLTEHRRRLRVELGREPTALELHTRTHQHKSDNRWVDEKSRKDVDDFQRYRESQPIGEGSSSGSTHLSDYQAWTQAMGGKKKGRIYGLGSAAPDIDSYASASAASTQRSAENDEMTQRVAALTKELEEMRRMHAMDLEVIKQEQAKGLDEMKEQQARGMEEMKKQQTSMFKKISKFFDRTRKKGKEKVVEPEPEHEDSEDTDDDD